MHLLTALIATYMWMKLLGNKHSCFYCITVMPLSQCLWNSKLISTYLYISQFKCFILWLVVTLFGYGWYTVDVLAVQCTAFASSGSISLFSADISYKFGKIKKKKLHLKNEKEPWILLVARELSFGIHPSVGLKKISVTFSAMFLALQARCWQQRAPKSSQSHWSTEAWWNNSFQR